MLATLRRSIHDHRLLRSGELVLIACSGGGDSIALLHGLSRVAPAIGVRVEVAIIDHGLRDVTREIALVRAQTEALGHRLHVEPVNVGKRDLQNAARRARYRALLAIAAERGAAKIATGHTLDDQAETVLMRAVRGHGLRGIRGIARRRRDGVIRPLLDLRRETLRAQLTRWQIPWAEDPSNEDDRFERIRFRRLLTCLSTQDPEATTHLAALAEEARSADAVVRASARRWQERLGGSLTRSGLRSMPRATRWAIFREEILELAGQPTRRAHLLALDQLIKSGRGHVLLGNGWLASLHEGALKLEHDPSRRSRSVRR